MFIPFNLVKILKVPQAGGEGLETWYLYPRGMLETVERHSNFPLTSINQNANKISGDV